MKTSNTSLRVLFNALGIAFSVLPPALAIILYFPVWVARGGEYTLSGIAVLLMLVAFVPIFKLVRRLFESPSGWAIWLVIFILFFLVSRIADEMITVSFIGLVGNILGAVMFRISRRFGGDEG